MIAHFGCKRPSLQSIESYITHRAGHRRGGPDTGPPGPASRHSDWISTHRGDARPVGRDGNEDSVVADKKPTATG